jgi:hypothetical protein
MTADDATQHLFINAGSSADTGRVAAMKHASGTS